MGMKSRQWNCDATEQLIGKSQFRKLRAGNCKRIVINLAGGAEDGDDKPDISNFDFTFQGLGFSVSDGLLLNFGAVSSVNLSSVFFGRATIEKSDFNHCQFSSIHSRNGLFSRNTRFENCVFNGARFVDSVLGVSSNFTSCQFLDLDCRGSAFHFGKCHYKKCVFSGNFPELQFGDVTFEDCVFHGAAKEVALWGGVSRRGRWWRRTERYSGVKFVSCDLQRLEVEKFEVFPDVELIDTKLPSYLKVVPSEIPRIGGGLVYGVEYSEDGYRLS